MDFKFHFESENLTTSHDHLSKQTINIIVKWHTLSCIFKSYISCL